MARSFAAFLVSTELLGVAAWVVQQPKPLSRKIGRSQAGALPDISESHGGKREVLEVDLLGDGSRFITFETLMDRSSSELLLGVGVPSSWGAP